MGTSWSTTLVWQPWKRCGRARPGGTHRHGMHIHIRMRSHHRLCRVSQTACGAAVKESALSSGQMPYANASPLSRLLSQGSALIYPMFSRIRTVRHAPIPQSWVFIAAVQCFSWPSLNLFPPPHLATNGRRMSSFRAAFQLAFFTVPSSSLSLPRSIPSCHLQPLYGGFEGQPGVSAAVGTAVMQEALGGEYGGLRRGVGGGNGGAASEPRFCRVRQWVQCIPRSMAWQCPWRQYMLADTRRLRT